MNTKEITDDELFTLLLEENEDARDLIYERYHFIIDINLNKYRKVAKVLNVDYKDYESAALYGFTDALLCFRQEKTASLPTFINLCVKRSIKKCFEKATTKKNIIFKDSYSLDYVYEKFGLPLLDLISDESRNDPLFNITSEESYQELLKDIKSSLSKLENEVFNYMVDGFNYRQIALILKKDSKQIDNAMQRIKSKVKKILKKREEMLDYK